MRRTLILIIAAVYLGVAGLTLAARSDEDKLDPHEIIEKHLQAVGEGELWPPSRTGP